LLRDWIRLTTLHTEIAIWVHFRIKEGVATAGTNSI